MAVVGAGEDGCRSLLRQREQSGVQALCIPAAADAPGVEGEGGASPHFGVVGGVRLDAGGADFSLALLENGQVFAWGRGINGQLGTGNRATSSVPRQVTGLEVVLAIAAGVYHALALMPDGHGHPCGAGRPAGALRAVSRRRAAGRGWRRYPGGRFPILRAPG